MHPRENAMPLPIITVGAHDDTTNNATAAAHRRRDDPAFTPSPPSSDHAADHRTPEPLAGNTLKDDPAGSVSSGSGGGGSAAGGTGGGGAGTNGRVAFVNSDEGSAAGFAPSNSGGDTGDSGIDNGGEASKEPPTKARLGPEGRNGTGAGAVGEATPIASSRIEVCDDESDDSLPTPSPSTSTIIGDCVGSDTGYGQQKTHTPPAKGLAGHHGGSNGDAGRDLDSTAPPSGTSEIPTRVLRKGNEEDDEFGNLPIDAGGGNSVGTGTGGGEEGSKRSYNEVAASYVDVLAADQVRGNSARDGDDPATRPPAGGNEGGSPAGGKGQTDGKPPTGGKPATNAAGNSAVEGEGRGRIGGREDLTAIGGDGDDVAPPPSLSSDAADQDESACGPFTRKLPDGGDSAGGVSSGGGGGTGTNCYLSGSYGDEAPAATAAACTAWVLTALHVALLQGVALRTTRVMPETGERPTALFG